MAEPEVDTGQFDLPLVVPERRVELLLSGDPLREIELAAHLGLELRRRAVPNQGVQREVELFGTTERVGFYNTFAAHCDTDSFTHRGTTVAVARDPATGEVHALRAPEFASVQFHAESILTTNGVSILSTLLSDLPARRARPVRIEPRRMQQA